jgi:hypothetical protein
MAMALGRRQLDEIGERIGELVGPSCRSAGPGSARGSAS